VTAPELSAGDTGVSPKMDPASFTLRVPQPKTVRFRRGLIIGLTGASSAALIAVTLLALRPSTAIRRAMTGEQMMPAHPSETVEQAPSSYADIPHPGARASDAVPDAPITPAAEPVRAPASPDAAAARQRIQSERLTALSSPVLVSRAAGMGNDSAIAAVARSADPAAVPADGAGGAPAAEGEQDPNNQRRKSELVFRPAAGGAVNPHLVQDPASPWLLSAGTVIAASLVTGLDSDLPGQVIAQVTETVCDSATGRTVLIPQGTRLIGKSDSMVSYGQRRALVVWDRIVLPDGSSIAIDNLPATDASGYTGIADTLDTHSLALIKGVMVSTVLGIGSALSFGHSDSDLARALRDSTQANADRAAQQITSKNLNVQPTVRVRPGWPIRVLVHQDLILRPWKTAS
jgi:type IV secretory pathway VirB10-like protein